MGSGASKHEVNYDDQRKHHRERHRSVGRQQRAEGHEKHYQQKAERYGQIRKNEEAKYNTTPERAERASENDDYTKEAAGKEVAVGPAHERKDSSSSDQLHYKDNDAHLDATSDKVGSPTTCSLDSQGIGTAAGGAKRFEKRISPGQMQSSGTAVKSTTKGNYDERRQYHRDRERSLSIQKLADNREQQCLQKADRYKQKKIDEEAKVLYSFMYTLTYTCIQQLFAGLVYT